MDKIIIDGMKKEGKSSRYLMIFGYILSILTPVANYLTNNEKYSNKDIIMIFAFCFVFGTIGLYGWLYAIKYSLEINEEKVMLKTLFRRVEINIKDITNYTCNRYGKSVFYQFRLFIKDKNILVNTRYKEEFAEILIEHEIKEK